MRPAPLPPLIGPEQAALIARRVSIIVGSRDAEHRPHVMRAVGCRLSADLRRITVFMVPSASGAVLADLCRNARIAVVFSEPSSHHTVQFKGSDAVVAPIEAGDEAMVARYLRNFAEEIAQLGFPADIVHTILGHDPGDLVAVHFTPLAGFEQTPGPTAGQALARHAHE
jgi:hypothetical protein